MAYFYALRGTLPITNIDHYLDLLTMDNASSFRLVPLRYDNFIGETGKGSRDKLPLRLPDGGLRGVET